MDAARGFLMPIFTAISALAGTTLFTVGSTAITLGSVVSAAFTIASIGFSVYQQMAARSAAKKARAAAQAAQDAQGLRFVGRGTAQPWQTCYGRVFKSGNVFFEQVKPPFYYVGIVLASHEIDGIEKLLINGKPITTDIAGYVTSKPYYVEGSAVTPNSSGVQWVVQNSRCQTSVRLGKDDQAADPILISDWPSLGANFRQQGHATLVLKCHYGASADDFQSVWGSEAPTPQAIFRGKKVYDPRDSAQLVDDKTTWRWSESVALCATDFLRTDFGGRLTSDVFDWQRTGESASIDEMAALTKAGKYEPQYVCAAVVDTSLSAVDVLRQFMLCNRGRFVSTADGYAVMSWRYRKPEFTIHTGLLAGAVDYQAEASRKDLVNVVRTRIIDPGSNYQVVDGPSYKNQSYIDADGQRYEVTLDLSYTSGGSRAQRLTKAFVEDARRGRSLVLPIDIEGFRLEPGDTVNVELSILPIVNGEYAVEDCELLEDYTGVKVILVETAPEIGYFDPAIDEVEWYSPSIEVD